MHFNPSSVLEEYGWKKLSLSHIGLHSTPPNFEDSHKLNCPERVVVHFRKLHHKLGTKIFNELY